MFKALVAGSLLVAPFAFAGNFEPEKELGKETGKEQGQVAQGQEGQEVFVPHTEESTEAFAAPGTVERHNPYPYPPQPYPPRPYPPNPYPNRYCQGYRYEWQQVGYTHYCFLMELRYAPQLGGCEWNRVYAVNRQYCQRRW